MADGPSGSATVDSGRTAETARPVDPAGNVEAVETGENTEADATDENDVEAPEVTAETADTVDAEVAVEATEKADTSPDAEEKAEPSDEVVSEPSAATAPSNSASSPVPTGHSSQLADSASESAPAEPPVATRGVTDVARGTRFADRYRLEEKLSSGGKSVTWRAVDEKLRRAVGIHIVAAGSEYARGVTAAARAAALVGDPRFVHVLDTAEEDGLVYVVKEWLPDADNLASLLAVNPLPPHEAYEMARSVADAMSVAHRAGLSHLRLDPENVLRMHTGQYKIVGLAVEAALYGHDTTDAARDDTRAIGSLLYACLARRWPDGRAFGLPEAPRTGTRLCTPGQVKAHVHGPLEAVAMRALGYDYKNQPPFETPEDVVAALAAIPPVLPPEPTVPVSAAGADFDDEYTPAAMLDKGGSGPRPPTSYRPVAAPTPPPALGGGFGQVVKVTVSVIVLIAVILTTWTIAKHVSSDKKDNTPSPSPSAPETASATPPAQLPQAQVPVPIKIVNAHELNVDGDSQNPEDVKNSYDGNTKTFWRTSSYRDGPDLVIRRGLGIIYDLGSEQDLRTAAVQLGAGGDHTTLHLMVAPTGSTSAPTSDTKFTEVGKQTTQGTEVSFTLDQPVRTRYVLVWLTAMPYRSSGDGVYTPGYQNNIVEVSLTT